MGLTPVGLGVVYRSAAAHDDSVVVVGGAAGQGANEAVIVSMLHTLASSPATMTTKLDEHFGPGD